MGYGLNAVGIALGCIGSISINIGNNLQAMGHAQQQAAAAAGGSSSGERPKEMDLWALGTGVFVIAALVQFTAFAFAPASVLAPLESLQFVANLAFAKWVKRQEVTQQMLWGTGLILLGVLLAVCFGPVDGTIIYPLERLVAYWDAPGWLTYLAVVIFLAGFAELVHGHYAAAQKRGQQLWQQAKVLPLAFATSSSLIGTQAVVQAKSTAEAVKLIAAGCAVELFESWYLYVRVPSPSP